LEPSLYLYRFSRYWALTHIEIAQEWPQPASNLRNACWCKESDGGPRMVALRHRFIPAFPVRFQSIQSGKLLGWLMCLPSNTLTRHKPCIKHVESLLVHQ